MATFFFYGLHINTAYHSSLINVLTNPRYESQIDTIERAIQEGLKFYIAESSLAFLEKNDQVRPSKKDFHNEILTTFHS